MSFEFFADVTLSDDVLAAIRAAFAAEPWIVVNERSGEAALSLRLTAHEADRRWPEDVVLHVHPSRACLVFYAANDHEIAAVLGVVHDCLRRAGHDALFEEE